MKKGKLLGIKNIGISVVGGFIAVKFFYLHVLAFIISTISSNAKDTFINVLYMLKVLEARGELELVMLKQGSMSIIYAFYGLVFILGFIITLIILYFVQKAMNKNKPQD